MFYLGLQSITHIFRNKILDDNEWEIFFASEEMSEIQITNNLIAKNKGKMTINEYADFAKSVNLAISIMNAPHPSYPPLEMAASGAVVITTEYENKKNLDMYSENIIVCEYNLDSIVQAVNKYNNLNNSDIEKL